MTAGIYIKTPFALSGDITAVPVDPQVDGSVSFTLGYPIKYSQDPNINGLRLDRSQMNYLFNAITVNLKQYQEETAPRFITAAENGGVAFSYAKYATVLYDAGSGLELYQSTVAANNTLPTDTSKWRKLDPYNQTLERVSPAFTGVPTAPTAAPATSTTQIATTAFVTAAISAVTNSVPSGSVSMYAASAPPSGWLECDGSAVSRTTYSALFAALGTVFGAGDGVNTFNLPDMRGYFPRGWDNGRGIDPARTFGSTQTDALKAHTHTADLAVNTPGGGDGSSYRAIAGAGNTGSTGGTETRPKNISLLFIIKT